MCIRDSYIRARVSPEEAVRRFGEIELLGEHFGSTAFLTREVSDYELEKLLEREQICAEYRVLE